MPIAPATHRRKHAGKKHGQVRNRQAKRALHTGSKQWRAIRKEILIRDDYTCRECEGFGDQVDHIDGDSSNNSADGSNYQTLCHTCHSRKTASETLNN